MNKLDLIIDALESASYVPRGVMYPAGYHMQIAQALAAARELRALEPVGWFDWDAKQEIWVQVYPKTHGKQLYALEQSNEP
jgi:hypothetical protein